MKHKDAGELRTELRRIFSWAGFELPSTPISYAKALDAVETWQEFLGGKNDMDCEDVRAECLKILRSFPSEYAAETGGTLENLWWV